MRKYQKTGLLIVLLVVPVFIFLFLKFFGTNHYDLPTYHPVKDPVSGNVVLTEGDTVYYAVTGLQLRNREDSVLISDEVLADKFTVVSYLPAVCGDTCQKVLTQLSRVHELHQTIPQVQLLTLSREEATPGEKAVLLREYPVNTGSWRVLTGSQEEINNAFSTVFRFDANIPMGRQTILPDKRLILVDDQGYIRGYYNALDALDVDRLMAEIKVLEYSNSLKK